MKMSLYSEITVNDGLNEPVEIISIPYDDITAIRQAAENNNSINLITLCFVAAILGCHLIRSLRK